MLEQQCLESIKINHLIILLIEILIYLNNLFQIFKIINQNIIFNYANILKIRIGFSTVCTKVQDYLDTNEKAVMHIDNFSICGNIYVLNIVINR